MLSKSELKKISTRTGLSLYQQEKDYLLKLFLFFYYRKFKSAVFKGGTCIKYLIGLDRFSEDLDFNLKTSPAIFKKQAEDIIKNIEAIGIKTKFKKQEIFPDAYTCTVSFEGPLFTGKLSKNNFRIDAGKRLGTILKPEWQLIKSEYPETPPVFLVLTMNKEEMLAEKIASIFSREKGRDIYDIWFLMQNGVKINKNLVEKKLKTAKIKIDYNKIVSKKEYERDMSRLTNRIIPYNQIVKTIKEKIY